MTACENQSLDGILTHPEKQPRSTWWAYKAYADVTGRLVDLRPSPTVDGVAAIDPKTGVVRAVLGRDGTDSGPVVVEFLNMPAAVSSASGNLYVHAERIPASGWKALVSPEVVPLTGGFSPGPNSIKITLPDFGFSDAYLLRLGAR